MRRGAIMSQSPCIVHHGSLIIGTSRPLVQPPGPPVPCACIHPQGPVNHAQVLPPLLLQRRVWQVRRRHRRHVPDPLLHRPLHGSARRHHGVDPRAAGQAPGHHEAQGAHSLHGAGVDDCLLHLLLDAGNGKFGNRLAGAGEQRRKANTCRSTFMSRRPSF